MKIGLYKRFVFSMLFFLVVPIFISLNIIFLKMSQDHTKIEKINGKQLTGHMKMQATSKIKEIEHMVKTIATYGKLLEFLDDSYNDAMDLERYNQLADSYIIAAASTQEDTLVRIYMTNQSIPMGHGIFYPMNELNEDPAIEKFIISSKIEQWLNRDFSPKRNDYLYLKKIFSPAGKVLGIIVVATPKQCFIFPPEGYEENQVQIIEKEDMFLINFGGMAITNEDIIKISCLVDGDKYNNSLVTIQEIENFPLKMIMVSSQDTSSDTLKLALGIIGIFIFLAILFLIKLIHDIFTRLEGYINEINPYISNGNFRSRLEIKGDNELSAIAKSINLLFDKIDSLIKTTMQQELMAKEARFIALQHQINPHFIYNTMETFSAQMEANGLFEESEAMVSFAKMFRYNVSADSKFSTVKAELQQVENYIDINKISDYKIDFSYSIPEEILNMKIIRFIFQPLVENSLLHGVNTNNNAIQIGISVLKKESSIIFEIWDNGEGIGEVEVQKLNHMFISGIGEGEKSEQGGIGLNNINVRLQLFYGENCTLKVESIRNSRTSFYFEVPVSTK